MEVRAPGYLHFFKDQKSAAANVVDNKDFPALELALIVDFKFDKDNQLVLDFADDHIKLRFKLVSDRDHWKSALQDWKSFSIDFGPAYYAGAQARESDLEDGTRASGGALLTPAQQAKFALASKQTAKELDSLQVEDTGSDEDLIGSKAAAASTTGKKVGAADNKSSSSGGGADKSSGGGMFGFGKSAAAAMATAAPSAYSTSQSKPAAVISNADIGEVKPAFIEGFLEKKGHGTIHIGSDWQKRYLRIDERTKAITYSKTQSLSEKPQGSIEFIQITDICAYSEKGDGKAKQDSTRFNIVVGDRTFKFKAKDKQENAKWVASLNEWKDYFLLTLSSA